ncbi:MAG TPA: cytochrome c [Vicinamibacterales bacterium]|jgi:mono/diheme cytochrome c family protein
MVTKLTTRGILPATLLTLAIGSTVSLAAAGQDEQVKKGQEVYAAQKCSMCHSIAGKGGKQSPLDGVGAKLSADEIRQWITNPTEMTAKMKSTKKPPMPNKYSKLPAADLDALVAYIQSLK